MPVMKRNGDVRICVDLKKVNAAVKRERITLPTFEQVTGKLQGSTVYSVLDGASGYWQLSLDEQSSKYTTFITPFGRFRFLKLPFGISIANEVFQRRMMDVLGDLEGVVVYQDDILVHGSSMTIHDERLEKLLARIKEVGLKLNREKCQFRKKSLNFLGSRISAEDISSDGSKVEAIHNIAVPENVTEMKRYIGILNYLGRHISNLSEMSQPLNDLLKKDVIWKWGDPQKEAFRKTKNAVSTAPTLAFYDVNKSTMVSSDASSYGLGGVLVQLHDDTWQPVAYCSRTMNNAGRKYARIEMELPTAIWTCERLSVYLVGLPKFKLQTDHKPLVPLMNTDDKDNTPLRCQRLLMRLMRYNIEAEYVPGKELIVADALSRSPLKKFETDLSSAVRTYVDAVVQSKPITDKSLDVIREMTEEDETIQEVLDYTLNGWPKYKRDIDPKIQQYSDVRSELSVASGLLLRGTRIIVPSSYRSTIMERIHDGHWGISKCRDRAAQAVWWPGINTEIQAMIQDCEHCQVHHARQQRQPLMPSDLPERPWQKVGMDLCEFKKQTYLVAVDYYSRYLEVVPIPNMTSTTVIAKVKTMCAHWGFPEEIVSDNGTQFTSTEFQAFAQSHAIHLTTSSPRYPRSNGEAERAVQTAKRILSQDDPWIALMVYRSTPVAATGFSPCELMMGRQIRNTLPVHPQVLQPKVPDQSRVNTNDQESKDKNIRYYNRGTKELPELKPGDAVRIRTGVDDHWGEAARVLHKHDSPRSYVVQTSSGQYRRNREHLQHVPQQHEPALPSAHVPDIPQQTATTSILAPTTPARVPPRAEPSVTSPTTPVRAPPRRSERERKTPSWIKSGDFVPK